MNFLFWSGRIRYPLSCFNVSGLTGLRGCVYGLVVRTVSVRVEDELLLRVKQRALFGGVSLTEVVQRLLVAYADERVHVRAAVEGTPEAARSAGMASGAGGSLSTPEEDVFPESEPFEDAP